MDKCPYCNQELERTPIRKSRCPHCKNIIYIKRRPDEDKQKLVTEDEANLIDQLWDVRNKIKEKNKLFEALEYLNLTREDFINFKYNHFPNATDFEVITKLIDHHYETLTTKKEKIDYHKFKITYFDLALYAAENGYEYFNLQQTATRFDLFKMRESGVIRKVQIFTTNENSCEECQKLDGTILTIEEALETMPIPVRECKTDYFKDGWCRCWYGTIIEDDYPPIKTSPLKKPIENKKIEPGGYFFIAFVIVITLYFIFDLMK